MNEISLATTFAPRIALASLVLALPLAAQAQLAIPNDLTPIARTDIPDTVWNYFSLQDRPPLPFDWLPDETNIVLYVSPSRGTNAIWLGDQDIDYVERAAEYEVLSLAAQAAGGSLTLDQSFEMQEFDYTSATDPWLEVTNVASDLAYFNLHNPTNQVYAIWTATNPVGPWSVEWEVWPTNQDIMPFTLSSLNRDSLFVRAQDWTGLTENGNTTPDWWFWQYFGTVALSDSTLDTLGNTLLYDYTNGLDPNVICFFLLTTNQHSSGSLTPVEVYVTAGMPTSMAVLVDSTNQAAATWIPYAASAVADLGTTQGWHSVSIGLRGRMETSQQTWQSIPVKLLLIPPALVLTNPVSLTVDRPVIQLQGYSSEALASLTYDLTNAAGLLTNLSGQILDQYYDATNREYTTNYFQFFDVQLTNGDNTITLRATDFAGNVAVTNLTFTLDYSGRTNPPLITLAWPTDGSRVGAPTFTWRGSVDDPTAQVTAMVVDTNGVTNVITGRVGRGGDFWIENVPLLQPTNSLTLLVTDAAGNSASTNLTVLQSDITLTVDSVSLTDETAGGQVSDPTCTVWVNGTQVANNGDGTWSATGLHLTLDDAVVHVQAIPQVGDGASFGNLPSGGERALAGSLDDPASPPGTDAEGQVAWPDGAIYTRAIHMSYYLDIFATPQYGPYTEQTTIDWQEQSGGSCSDSVTAAPPNYNFSWEEVYDAEYTWPGGRWPDLPDGVEVYDGWNGSGTWNTPSAAYSWADPSEPIVDDADFFYPLAVARESRHDHDQIILVPEGVPGESGLAIYGITCSATATAPGYEALLSPIFTNYTLPPENIQLGTLGSPDSQGFMLAAVQKRNPADITPTVNGAPYAAVSILPQPYQLVIQAVATTPTNRARTTIGVGEQVKLTLTPALPYWVTNIVTWNTSTGSLSAWYGNTTTLTAPSNATTATVTMYYNRRAFPTTFTVVEPTGIDHAVTVERKYFPVGQAAAGMHLCPYVGPTNVSFYRVQLMEVGQPATGITGYFVTNSPPPHDYVHLADHFDIQLGYDNSWPASYDWAVSPVFAGPWSDGQFTWHIPGKWKIGSGPTNDLSGSWDQVFTLAPNGTVTVTKFGHTVTRNTSENYGVVVPDP